MIIKTDIKNRLKIRMGRTPHNDEVENGLTDQGLITEILMEKYTDIESRLSVLENKVKSRSVV